MSKERKRGLGFGVTSGVLTTLGLISGLSATLESKLIVIGGIASIAVADAFSDSLGTHISEESISHNNKKAFSIMGYTFISKFLIAITFMFPYILFSMSTAFIISIIWGIFILSIISYIVAENGWKNKIKTILEHLSIAFVILFFTFGVGSLIKLWLG